MQLKILEAAAFSILEQGHFYAEVADSALVLRWEASVKKGMRRLLIFPEAGSLAHFKKPTLAGLRWIVVPGFPKHLILYRYVPSDPAVVIVDVVHGSRDVEAVLHSND